MDWDDLRYFLAVARTGSLSAAARELTASPATIGRRIAAFETVVGQSLFDRLNSGYLLTPIGREILAEAEIAEAAIRAVGRTVDPQTDPVSGPVRLATGEALATHLLAPELPRFQSSNPGILIEFVTGFRSVSLTRREADVGLRLLRPDEGDLVRRKIGTVGFGLYASRNYLRGREGAEQEKKTLDVIGWDGSMRDIPMAGWLPKDGHGRVVATTTSMNVQISLTRAALGAAVIPCFVADSEPELCRVPGTGIVGAIDLWLVARRDLSRLPRIRRVLDFVAEICSSSSAKLTGA